MSFKSLFKTFTKTISITGLGISSLVTFTSPIKAENFNMKALVLDVLYFVTNRVSKYRTQPKHQDILRFAHFLKISENCCEGFCIFWTFDAFSADYSDRL